MYFDAVLDKDYFPVFNGTPEETKKALEEHPSWADHQVSVGRDMSVVSVKDYLEGK